MTLYFRICFCIMRLTSRWKELFQPTRFVAMRTTDLFTAIVKQKALAKRLQECGLEMHSEKTKIVYCKDDNRKAEHPVTNFEFLGYKFRPRCSKTRSEKLFVSFSPAMSASAGKAIRQTARGWRLQLCTSLSLAEIAWMVRAKIQGWNNYYGRFYKSAMYVTL